MTLLPGINFISKVIKYYIDLEKLRKLNENAYRILHLFQIYFNWFLYKITHRIAFNTFKNKTIISEINDIN